MLVLQMSLLRACDSLYSPTQHLIFQLFHLALVLVAMFPHSMSLSSSTYEHCNITSSQSLCYSIVNISRSVSTISRFLFNL